MARRSTTVPVRGRTRRARLFSHALSSLALLGVVAMAGALAGGGSGRGAYSAPGPPLVFADKPSDVARRRAQSQLPSVIAVAAPRQATSPPAW